MNTFKSLNDRQIALLDNMIDVQLYDLDLEQDTDLYLELCALKYVLGKSNNTIEGE
tara:strand:- start:189 stop:356 length:168 start_codon:yes stop_codon:yes gene_type:complete